MLKKLLHFAWIGLMVLMVAACEGPEGPAGPKGDTGATGAPGPAGQDGQDGTGGGGGGLLITTGEIESDSLGGFGASFPLTAGLDSLMETAAILVYVKTQGVYWPLPGYVIFGQNNLSDYTFVHGIEENTFFVEIFQLDWSGNSTTPPARELEDLRIVIIPNIVLQRMNAETLKSYEKTIDALNLTDKQIKSASSFVLKRQARTYKKAGRL